MSPLDASDRRFVVEGGLLLIELLCGRGLDGPREGRASLAVGRSRARGTPTTTKRV